MIFFIGLLVVFAAAIIVAMRKKNRHRVWGLLDGKEQEMINTFNDHRAVLYNSKRLRVDKRLNELAQKRCLELRHDMMNGVPLSHDGMKRHRERYVDEHFRDMKEIILYDSFFIDGHEMADKYIASPEHKEIIEKRRWDLVGSYSLGYLEHNRSKIINVTIFAEL